MMIAVTSDIRFEGIATALSAISHLGDSAGGTTAVFRREKVFADGRVIEAPILSGNGFRGLLRDRGMAYMLRELGNPTLSPAAFHFLTSGGALTKDSGRGLDIGQARRLRELIPLVGVLGGACGRQILEGKLQVGKWYPVCRELRVFLPEQYRDMPEAEVSLYDLTDVHSFTRTDDAKSERWQKVLPAPERTLLEAPKVRTAKDGTEIAEKPGVAQQMRYSQEVLIAGTKFYVWLQLQDVTDLEYEAFASALVEWSKAPFIGGQSRHGCGLVELNFDNWISVSPLAHTAAGVARPLGTAYHDHLHSQREAILSALGEIA
jgi:CRISPR type IV-associated protein Csf2